MEMNEVYERLLKSLPEGFEKYVKEMVQSEIAAQKEDLWDGVTNEERQQIIDETVNSMSCLR